MWAQLIKMRVKPGRDAEVVGLFDRIRALEQADSGLLRTVVMADQNDPDVSYTLVVFESQEKARAREQDPRRQEGMAEVRTAMADIFEGPPEFVDLAVLSDLTA